MSTASPNSTHAQPCVCPSSLSLNQFYAITQCQVLEPKDGKVIYKDWDAMGSDISKLETFDDDEQPLPQNVMYPGTSDYWPSDGSN